VRNLLTNDAVRPNCCACYYSATFVVFGAPVGPGKRSAFFCRTYSLVIRVIHGKHVNVLVACNEPCVIGPLGLVRLIGHSGRPGIGEIAEPGRSRWLRWRRLLASVPGRSGAGTSRSWWCRDSWSGAWWSRGLVVPGPGGPRGWWSPGLVVPGAGGPRGWWSPGLVVPGAGGPGAGGPRGWWCRGERRAGRDRRAGTAGGRRGDFVSLFGHSGALMALVPHFRRRFVLFCPETREGLAPYVTSGYRRVRMSPAHSRDAGRCAQPGSRRGVNHGLAS
jgi:hypothetical protein